MRFVLAALAVLLPAIAQAAMAGDDFLRRAVMATSTEIEVGRMAQAANTVSPSIQTLGRQAVAEAMVTGGRLVELAVARGVAVDGRVDDGDRAALDRLSRLRGAAFTRDWLGVILDRLERRQALFQVADDVDDPELAQFVRDALPQISLRLMVLRAVYDAQIGR